jgi:hypothetical protein
MTGKRFMKKVSGGRDKDLGGALMIWATQYCGQMWRKTDGIWGLPHPEEREARLEG